MEPNRAGEAPSDAREIRLHRKKTQTADVCAACVAPFTWDLVPVPSLRAGDDCRKDVSSPSLSR